jgi:hypothetical protein
MILAQFDISMEKSSAWKVLKENLKSLGLQKHFLNKTQKTNIKEW